MYSKKRSDATSLRYCCVRAFVFDVWNDFGRSCHHLQPLAFLSLGDSLAEIKICFSCYFGPQSVLITSPDLLVRGRSWMEFLPEECHSFDMFKYLVLAVLIVKLLILSMFFLKEQAFVPCCSCFFTFVLAFLVFLKRSVQHIIFRYLLPASIVALQYWALHWRHLATGQKEKQQCLFFIPVTLKTKGCFLFWPTAT